MVTTLIIALAILLGTCTTIAMHERHQRRVCRFNASLRPTCEFYREWHRAEYQRALEQFERPMVLAELMNERTATK